ncbi:hypothetical protein IIB34_06570 [PVC group bacterium]|nr:hypothetical protein [PVC group bacterium]
MKNTTICSSTLILTSSSNLSINPGFIIIFSVLIQKKGSVEKNYAALEYSSSIQIKELEQLREHINKTEQEALSLSESDSDSFQLLQAQILYFQEKELELEKTIEYIHQEKIELAARMTQIDTELIGLKKDLLGDSAHEELSLETIDEIILSNGNRLVGDIVRENDTKIVLRLKQGGELVLDQSSVASKSKIHAADFVFLWPQRNRGKDADVLKDLKPANFYAKKTFDWIMAQHQSRAAWMEEAYPLIANYEGSVDCYTYDQALGGMLYVLTGQLPKARRILNFYNDALDEQIEKFGRFNGFSDFYRTNGWSDQKKAAGPNAWLLMAITYYTRATQDQKYMNLAQEIADWLCGLQKDNGGITGGYETSKKKMLWTSTEHNLDCYAALKGLAALTHEKRFENAESKVHQWLKDVAWNEHENRFNLGENDLNYATDVSSWAVLVLGSDYDETLDFAVEKSRNQKYYSSKSIWVDGFDFGATYADGPYPDKDTVWFEGTAQMALAYFYVARESEGAYYLKEVESALTESQNYRSTLALPQASNAGTPAYGGWALSDDKLAVAPTIWYLFAHYRFNPFTGERI